MTDPAKLSNEALQLPSARAAQDTEAAWHAEVDRRLKEIDEGRISTTPWSEVRESILRH